MRNGKKIGWLFVIILLGSEGMAQTEEGFIPFSNKLLLNPSFAGLNKNSNIWSGLQFYAQPENKLNQSFSFTYDTWSEKMKSGVGLYFFQGLTGEVNTNTTGFGVAFSKPFTRRKTGQLIPSVNLNVRTATKQWFVQLIDGILNKVVEPPSAPGEDFMRYTLFSPRLGLLWNSPYMDMGLSASYTYQQTLAPNEEMPEQAPIHIVFHFAKKSSGKKRGLVSKPYRASPELTILYSENIFVSRGGFRMEEAYRVLGFYIQNDYLNNIHGIAGVFGWKPGNVRINVVAGGAYSIPLQKPVAFGEVSLGLIIPYVHFDKNNPWAPPKKSF